MADYDNFDTRLSTIEAKVDRTLQLVEANSKHKVKPYEEGTQDFSCDENEERGNWSGRLDFLLACLGYAVGLGNVWRFPYLCYKNGGAVFFIPYCIMLLFVGMPIFFLELSLGQFTSNGPLTCWEMAPVFKGIGVAMVVVSGLVAIYYNVIIAWAIYYLVESFTADLPWQYCDYNFNTQWCATKLDQNMTAEYCVQIDGLYKGEDGVCWNTTTNNATGFWNQTLANENGYAAIIPEQEYLNQYILGKGYSTGIDDMGNFRWQLVVCLLGAWVIVILSLINGIKSSGKVVYFTALFPYVVLIILFVRGMLLPGMEDGIRFYILEIQWDRLYDPLVWKDAAVQIFFSLSASWGGLIALASYNRFHNDCLRDSLIVSLGNCLTSFFAGFVIFSFLGYLAYQQNAEVADVVESGVGLAFIVYPSAVISMPLPTLWAILFFLMLITLGLDSEFALVETVTTSIMDQFPKTRNYKWAVILVVAIIFFLCGLSMCTDGGAFMLQLMDTYSGGWNVLVIAFLECVCVMYVYGFRRYRKDIQVMIGRTPCCCVPWNCCQGWWALCWHVMTPLGVLFILGFSLYKYEPASYGDYLYPLWGDALGWLMTLAVVLSIFITMIVMFCLAPGGGCGEKMKWLRTPTVYWGPALPRHRKLITYVPDFVVDPWGDQVDSDGMNGAPPNYEKGHQNEAYENTGI